MNTIERITGKLPEPLQFAALLGALLIWAFWKFMTDPAALSKEVDV